MLDEFVRNLQLFAEVVAELACVPGRRGIAAWYTAGERASTRDYLAVMDARLAQLEAGLPL
jgi:hypothetical protein